jgi:hypothetical protein
MVIGYKYFLRKVAGLLESGDNFTVGAASRSLNMKPEEFRQLLSLMENSGDIEIREENINNCSTSSSCCKGCGACHKSKSVILTGASYRLTESGKRKLMLVEEASNIHRMEILDL